MSWFHHARRGAAFEFGRRMWAWFAAAEIIRWFTRTILPIVLILAAVVLAVVFAVRTAVWWLPRLTLLAILATTLTGAVWLTHRYRWELRASLPRTAVAAGVLALASVLGTVVVWWLR
ncbi:hypothetical protein AB0M02_41095 [Actinoplanes sp. NPDC051861]|uniref:hypothetical protein n=1 Tax=Actinoplanes sp. NPDC051861 TaxID=3155170 RepID=UPI00342B6D80